MKSSTCLAVFLVLALCSPDAGASTVEEEATLLSKGETVGEVVRHAEKLKVIESNESLGESGQSKDQGPDEQSTKMMPAEPKPVATSKRGSGKYPKAASKETLKELRSKVAEKSRIIEHYKAQGLQGEKEAMGHAELQAALKRTTRSCKRGYTSERFKWSKCPPRLKGEEVEESYGPQSSQIELQETKMPLLKENGIAKDVAAVLKGRLLSGTATQSSQHGSGSAGKAVDGNTNQQYKGNSCTHTNKKSPWWKLSLGQEMSIARVEVWNRADCCGSRLRGVQVKVGSQLCGSLTSSTAKQTIRCNEKTGAVVELKMPRNDYLSLCEVKVYGTKPTPAGPTGKRPVGNKMLDFWGIFPPPGVKVVPKAMGGFRLHPKSYTGNFDASKSYRIMVGGLYWHYQSLNKACARINLGTCAHFRKHGSKKDRYGRYLYGLCPDIKDMQPWFKYLELDKYRSDSKHRSVGTVCGVQMTSATSTIFRGVNGTCILRGAEVKMDTKKVMFCENLARLSMKDKKKKGMPKTLRRAKMSCRVARNAEFKGIGRVYLTINYGHPKFKRHQGDIRWKNCESSGVSADCSPSGNSQVLAGCKAWGRWSKQDNGCQAFHAGWAAGSNSCHSCSTTTRAYKACSPTECKAACQDLYSASASSNTVLCKSGCDKYAKLGGCTMPTLPQCKREKELQTCTASQKQIWNDACGHTFKSRQSFNTWMATRNSKGGPALRSGLQKFWWRVGMDGLQGAALSL